MFRLDIDTTENNNLDIKINYENKNIETVCVSFGICSKSAKIQCKQQLNHCLTCKSFNSTIKNIPQYETEILRVKEENQIAIKYNREDIVSKNNEYLNILNLKLDALKGTVI